MNIADINVLVIDDDKTTRRIVSRLTKQFGFKTLTEAENGLEAWQLLQESEFGLILCDWDMPIMNGLELLQKIRQDPQMQDIPFIMVTANDAKENIIKAIQAGVSQYIVKPFTAPALSEKINKVLKLN